MSKTVIIYTTKYNTTKKYAGWLAIKIDADLYELSDIRGSDLKNYDTIIFGAPIENGYIRGVEFIKDNIQKIKDKQIIIFYVGLGLYTLDEIMLFNFLPTYKYKNIKNNMFTKKHFFYLYIFVKSKTKRKDTYVNM